MSRQRQYDQRISTNALFEAGIDAQVAEFSASQIKPTPEELPSPLGIVAEVAGPNVLDDAVFVSAYHGHRQRARQRAG